MATQYLNLTKFQVFSIKFRKKIKFLKKNKPKLSKIIKDIRRQQMQSIIKLTYSTLLVMITAWLCATFTHSGIEGWYNTYEKPFGTPPNWIFSPMWTLIYALMIISFFMVLDTASHLKKRAVILFISQLFLQILWCWAYFSEGFLGLSLAIIIILDIVYFKMIRAFKKISPTASQLNWLGFVWLCYATFLNSTFVYAYGSIIEF